MAPVSLSRAAQFVCSGCCTIQSKRGSTQEHREPGSAVSGLQHSGKRHCHQSPLHLSPPQAAPPAAVGTFSAASSLVSPLPSPGCVSSLLCQTQVLQKNTPSLSPSPNHGAGLKTTGRKGDRKTDTTFWAVFFASWVFGGRGACTAEWHKARMHCRAKGWPNGSCWASTQLRDRVQRWHKLNPAARCKEKGDRETRDKTSLEAFVCLKTHPFFQTY